MTQSEVLPPNGAAIVEHTPKRIKKRPLLESSEHINEEFLEDPRATGYNALQSPALLQEMYPLVCRQTPVWCTVLLFFSLLIKKKNVSDLLSFVVKKIVR